MSKVHCQHDIKDIEIEVSKKIHKRVVEVRIDGVPNMLRSHLKIWQLVWLLVFVSSSVISCYLIIKSTGEYLEYQVTTSYRLVSEKSPTFPTISICNLNALNSDYFVQLMNDANLTSTINFDPYINLLALENYHVQTTGRYFSNEEKRAMFDMDGFIISCTFLNKPCNVSDFRYLLVSFLTNCIQFNSGYDTDGEPVKLRELASSGQFNELSMELYVGLPDAIATRLADRGVKIIILKNNESPYKNSPSWTLVKPGLSLKMSVERKQFKQFNQWPYLYSECLVSEDNTPLKQLDDMSFINKITEDDYSYSKETCLLHCYNILMSQVCNCSAYWIRWQIPGLGYCLAEQADCSDDFYYKKFNIGSFIEDNCMNRCPLECDLQRYDNRASFFNYPDPLYVKNILQKNDMLIRHHSHQNDFTHNVASNVVKFTVSYNSLLYAEAKEEAKIPWDAFLATIGCHLHLFLGMSAISIVEIVELLAQINIYLFSGLKCILE